MHLLNFSHPLDEIDINRIHKLIQENEGQDVQVDINLTSTVGISDLRSMSIQIYPNPATDHIYVEVSDNGLTQGYHLKIINQIGAAVYYQHIKESVHEIDLTDWSGYGLYYLQVIDSGGEVIGTKKIILQ